MRCVRKIQAWKEWNKQQQETGLMVLTSSECSIQIKMSTQYLQYEQKSEEFFLSLLSCRFNWEFFYVYCVL